MAKYRGGDLITITHNGKTLFFYLAAVVSSLYSLSHTYLTKTPVLDVLNNW